jgi:hypothetical protein
MGEHKCSLGLSKSSLGDAKSSLGDAKSSLGDAKSSLGDVKSSLGDAEISLGDAESSLVFFLTESEHGAERGGYDDGLDIDDSLFDRSVERPPAPAAVSQAYRKAAHPFTVRAEHMQVRQKRRDRSACECNRPAWVQYPPRETSGAAPPCALSCAQVQRCVESCKAGAASTSKSPLEVLKEPRLAHF